MLLKIADVAPLSSPVMKILMMIDDNNDDDDDENYD